MEQNFQKALEIINTKDYRNRFHSYYDLMQRKVGEVLLVSSLYDNFTLEEDGHLSDQIFAKYQDLGLSTPPRITRVSNSAEALEAVEKFHFDVVITMRRIGDMDPFSFGRNLKEIRPDLPTILLLTNFAEIAYLPTNEEREGIDQIFVWNGDSEIFLAIIKLIEDFWNVKADTEHGLVRVIIIVEDSIHYYSMFLPIIYREIVKHTQMLMADGVNHHHRLLMMRGRPKILLAQSYETAIQLYDEYKEFIIGVMSDVHYPRNGIKDPDAGIHLINYVKQHDPYVPTLLMSTDKKNKSKALKLESEFLHKTSPNLLYRLRNFMKKNMGFGDFIFRLPDGTEVGRAENIFRFEEAVKDIPIESLRFHGMNNHFSGWLLARGEYELAQKLRSVRVSEQSDGQTIRQFLTDFFSNMHTVHQYGLIADFDADDFDPSIPFVRLGKGSLGGKGRGLAFFSNLLATERISERFPDVDIDIPNTIVLSTDCFDSYMDEHDLFAQVTEDLDDEEIQHLFLSNPLPEWVESALRSMIVKVDYPIAVRSSSLLEDSQFQPFAGIYATYMLPNMDENLETRLAQLSDAIRLVYASTYSRSAKRYTETIGQKIEIEKMAVLIQKLIGQPYEDRFYPDLSGVVQSYNYYPIARMKPEEGIAHIALGLGATITDGGKALSFSPHHPRILPQMSNPADALKNSQSEFIALKLHPTSETHFKKENANLQSYPLKQAEEDGPLKWAASTYDYRNDRITDTIAMEGPRVITFASILKFNQFPLSEILTTLLDIGEDSFGCPVDVEFAVTHISNDKPEFRLLQMRPLISDNDRIEVDVDSFIDQAVILSRKALGNGVIPDVTDIVYVTPEQFDNTQTMTIKDEISQLNNKLSEELRHYVLIGPGRWGTRDRFLGIPVDWNDIHFARVIVETGLEDFRIDPSQGMHFFVNVTTTGMGYLTVPYNSKDDYINWDWIYKQPVHEEYTYIRRIKLDNPLNVRINGKTSEGIIVPDRFPASPSSEVSMRKDM